AMEFRTLARRVREHFAKEKGAAIVAQYAGETPPPASLHIDVPSADEAVFEREKYACVRDLATLEKWIARAKGRGEIGLDTEADSFDAARAELVGVSMALGPNDACYVPLAHRSADARAGELFAGEEDPTPMAADAGAQIGLAEAVSALKPLLEDASVL